MICYNRIFELAKENGISLSFISKKINRGNNYLQDAARKQVNISIDILEIIANVLNTSVEYLTGETDKKEDAPVNLDRRTKRVIKIYDSLPDEQKKIFDSLLDQFEQLSALSNTDFDTDD